MRAKEVIGIILIVLSVVGGVTGSVLRQNRRVAIGIAVLSIVCLIVGIILVVSSSKEFKNTQQDGVYLAQVYPEASDPSKVSFHSLTTHKFVK